MKKMTEKQKARHNRTSELRLENKIKRKVRRKVVRLQTEKAAIRLRRALRKLRAKL